MTAGEETALQVQVIDLAHLFRWRVAHFRPALTKHGWRTPVQGDGAGFSDLLLVRERIIFAELKSSTGKLSSDQRAWLAAATAAGAEAYVWRPRDLQAIAKILRKVRPRDQEVKGMAESIGPTVGEDPGACARS
ncbi:MAG: VRR-NUC domain-containing protein [Vicinamibacterales bacterium]